MEKWEKMGNRKNPTKHSKNSNYEKNNHPKNAHLRKMCAGHVLARFSDSRKHGSMKSLFQAPGATKTVVRARKIDESQKHRRG